jgi:hypothetical protein
VMYLIKSLLLLFVTINLPHAYVQDYITQTEKYFGNKHEVIEESKADPINIKKAIQLHKKSKKEPESIIGLLKSYEFFASYTKLSERKKNLSTEKRLKLLKKQKKPTLIMRLYCTGMPLTWHVGLM